MDALRDKLFFPFVQFLQCQPDELIRVVLDHAFFMPGDIDCIRQVPVRPHNQVGHEIDQILAHGGEVVQLAAPAVRVRDRGDQAILFKLFQTTGQDAAGDQLFRFEHVFVFVNAQEHQVADDQQRPVVPHNIQGTGNRAPGALFMFGLGNHPGLSLKCCERLEAGSQYPRFRNGKAFHAPVSVGFVIPHLSGDRGK